MALVHAVGHYLVQIPLYRTPPLTRRKKYWLVPLILVLLIMGGLLVIAQGSVLAPFIYTLF